MSFGQLSVKGRALRYLAQREHSRLELERKLARHVQDTAEQSAGEQIAQALDALAAADLQSETRVAESVLRCQGARFGGLKLRQTLQAKGLEPGLVSDTLQLARATESERALAVWQRKFGAPPADAQAKARQHRFMASRGFSSEVVRRIVQGVEDDD